MNFWGRKLVGSKSSKKSAGPRRSSESKRRAVRLPDQLHAERGPSGVWDASPLEGRIMLDAAGGGELLGDVSTALTSIAPVVEATAEIASASLTETAKTVVVVDSRVTDWQALVGSAPEQLGAEIVLLTPHEDGLQQISRALRGRQGVTSLHLVAHGSAGEMLLGRDSVDCQRLDFAAPALAEWQQALAPQADILVYGCEVGQGRRGQAWVQQLAQHTGTDVAASTNRTGSAAEGADWILERQVGTIEAPLVVALAAQQAYTSVLPITIYAAGSTNQERMELQIDGVTVQGWDNVGGNASSRVFQQYTYSGGTGVTADRVRVVFTNDLYNPGVVDRNLRVDRINLNGVDLESEAPSVFSTGTWLAADGVTPGFRQSEYLHANGYFQYGQPAAGSSIAITARGQTGAENMSLQIDGQTVRSWTNIGTTTQTFTYTANQTVAASRVRVVFENDLYEPQNNIDRNLIVDRLTIDGTVYQTEAPTVYSTGTWLAADGVTPGFRQSETLHANGYFQYDATPAQPGVIGLANSVYSVGESGTISLNVLRQQGSDGVVTVDYRTVANTATAGSDFGSQSGTLVFNPGETQKSVTVAITPDSLTEGNETFAFVIDNVTGGAQLLVPRTATITIQDDDLPNYASFASVAGLQLNGAAAQAGSALRLTSEGLNLAGSAYFSAPLPIADSTSFQTSFRLQLSAGQGTSGADGMTFVLQNSAAGRNALGGVGGSLGYGGIGSSLAIKFDTWQNANEVGNNQVAVITNGNVAPEIITRNSPVDLNGGGIVYAWVDYQGTTNQLAVYVASTATKPTAPLIVTTVDLPALVGSQAYLGFTAATGGAGNRHDVLSWQFNTNPPPTAPAPNPGSQLVTQNVVTGLSLPTAVDWSADGRNMYVADQAGRVYVVRDGVRLASPFIDISAQVNGTRDRGLLDIAVHPDFVNNPYVYLLFTYDPPEVYNYVNDPLAGPDKNGNRAGRLVRVTANAATNYTTAVAGSEVVLLGTNSTWNNFNGFVNSTVDFNQPPAGILANGTNLRDFINSDSESHTVGAVEFGTDGSLLVSIGDGASYNRVDPRAVRVQDINNLSGKLLRIDPLTGRGLASNPFYNGDPDANRSKVYQYGFRNPFRISVDPANGRIFVGDVGWTTWEEVNTGGPGANFGWPYYEGASGTSQQTPGYRDLPQAQAFYASGQAVTPARLALNHSTDGINAIVMGDVYRGNVYPSQYQGDLFFNDLGQGIVRNVSFDSAGNVTQTETFATGANVVVQIAQGPDGLMYFVDLDSGTVGRWLFV